MPIEVRKGLRVGDPTAELECIGQDSNLSQLRDGIDRLEPARARRLLQSINRIQADVERVEKLLQRAATSSDR